MVSLSSSPWYFMPSLDFVPQAKVEMLDNLLDIEVAYSLLRGGSDDSSKDPIDVNYEKLRTDIKVSTSPSPLSLRLILRASPQSCPLSSLPLPPFLSPLAHMCTQL